MMNPTCETVNELLVDFADDVLPETESLAVCDHLKHCPSCRQELDLLRRSLAHAQSLWEAAATCAVPTKYGRMKTRTRRIGPLVATACLLAAVAVGVWLLGGPRPDDAMHDANLQAVHDERQKPAAEAVPTLDDVESLIAREVQSARLAVSAELLATHASLAEYQRQADLYLVETYGESPASHLSNSGDFNPLLQPRTEREP